MEFSKIFKRDKIRLVFSLENCKENSTYALEFRIIDFDDSEENFTTEDKKNKNKGGTIHFTKTFSCEYDFSKIEYIKLNLKRWGVSKFINLSIKEPYHLSLSTIVSSKNSVFKTKSRENTDDCETIIISAENPEYSSEEKNLIKFNFFDYLKAGIEFNSFIIIDFSNKNLHTDDENTNQFLQSIQGIRETLFEYLKTFKVYGYGASLMNGINNGKKFFNLSLEQNPELKGYTAIKNKYFDCLKKINFEENGYLSPVFKNIQKEIFDKYEPTIYNIIFLLIHNKPSEDDLHKCVDYLIESSRLPLSIVTIFIGDKSEEEIKALKQIFSNKKRISSNYVERIRNNVSFFSMKNCNFNNDILKNKCLREIPDQLLEFYRYGKTSPEDIKKNDVDRIKESFKDFDPLLSMYEDAVCAPSIIDQKVNNQEKKTVIINKDVNKLVNNIIFKEDKKEKKISNDNDNDEDKKGYINTPGKDDINDKGMINKPIEKINLDLGQKNSAEIKNPFRKKNYANDTPDPDKININNINNKNNINNEEKKIITNPFAKKKEKKKEENKIEKNEININNINEIKKENNINNEIIEDKKYINNDIDININNKDNDINNINNNEIIEDKKYINNDIDININNKNNNINNINHNINRIDKEKKYVNTPNPDDINVKRIISNPYINKNKNIIEEKKQEEKKKKEKKKEEKKKEEKKKEEKKEEEKKEEEKKEEEKKYINSTPGNDIIIPKNKTNPFQRKKEEKMKKKEEEKKEEKKKQKIGSHFKTKLSLDNAKLSTNANSGIEFDNYSRDN